MSEVLKQVRIENDGGNLIAYYEGEGDFTTEYFYETYWHPSCRGGYDKGYRDGWEDAMLKVRNLTNE